MGPSARAVTASAERWGQWSSSSRFKLSRANLTQHTVLLAPPRADLSSGAPLRLSLSSRVAASSDRNNQAANNREDGNERFEEAPDPSERLGAGGARPTGQGEVFSLRGQRKKKRHEVALSAGGAEDTSPAAGDAHALFDAAAAAAVAASRVQAMARLHAHRTGAEERHRQHLNGKRMAAKEAANEVSRAFRTAQGKESDACSTTSTISAYTTTSLATSSTGTSNTDSHSTTGSAQHEDDSSQVAKERADRARKLVIERARERAAVKAAKEAEATESKEPPRGAGADIERSRKEAANRLAKVDHPTLEIEVSTDAGVRRAWGSAPISPSKGVQEHEKEKSSEGESAKGQCQVVPLRIHVDKGKGKETSALPSELTLGGGSSATGTITSTNGAPVLGRLAVGGTQVGFALHGAPQVAEKAAEALGKLQLQCIGVPSLEALGTGVARTAMSRNFITSLDDGVPVQRVTVIDAPGELAVEAVIDRNRLQVYVRRATLAEVRRQEAIEGLKEAEASNNYDFLHGKIVAARARGVASRRLDAAAARLKQLNPDTASQLEVSEALQWEKVTNDSRSEAGMKTGLICCDAEGCTVGKPLEGEAMNFIPSAAAEALKDIKTGGIPHDQWLFERIAAAATAAAADGGVWRSGGKYILSAVSRNQSPVALGRYLVTIGQSQCAAGIDALVKWTEAKYNHHVSAIQINVHFDASAFHAQHRDIYGLEQRDMAGRDCTCSFQPNIATACLSLGSNRRCLVEAETDNFSQLKACCDDCKGYHCSHWLQSGCMMYFNDVWNRSHTHGIPQFGGDASPDGAGGPRISVAMLCAAGAEDPLALCSRPKAKNIYSTLIDKRQEPMSLI